MLLEDLVLALDLPAGSRVDQRVPKKMLAEHGGATPADRRLLTEGIEEAYWLAAIKPGTAAVPVWRDDQREYVEVAVVTVQARATHARSAQLERLAELVHRAVPYPVLLIVASPDSLVLSLAHKRAAQNEAGKTVLDGDLISLALTEDAPAPDGFLAAMSLDRQPHLHLMALYQGWIDVLTAAQAGRVTGHFAPALTPEEAAARRSALREHQRLEQEVTRLRALAANERQIAKRVEHNLALQRVQAELRATLERL